MQFRTKARAVDLLGKGQIADLPTAISELWKNGYDAYADNLNAILYTRGYEDVKNSFVVVSDDGKGMSFNELEEKWLILGTDSKSRGKSLKKGKETLWKEPRPIMGEKGIGRLSVSYLGSPMLMLTKKIGHPLQALYFDWRILENYNLFLDDVHIPIASIDNIKSFRKVLDELKTEFLSNFITPNDEKETKKKQKFWIDQKELLNTIIEDTHQLNISDFFEDEIVKNLIGDTDNIHGTKFIIFKPDEQFEILKKWTHQKNNADDEDIETVNDIRTGLIGFHNEFKVEKDKSKVGTTFIIKDKTGARDFIGSNAFFSSDDFKNCDHLIDGAFDEHGTFKGDIRIYKKIVKNYKYRSNKPADILSPYGKFNFKLGYVPGKTETSLEDKVFDYFDKKLKASGGLYIYRDNLRVLPYGRPHVDFLHFEEKRTKRAGTYFFSYRRMFGYIELTRSNNPQLKDKAGREGFINNVAFREFRMVLEGLFLDLAKEYFGTDAKQDIKKKQLDKLKDAKASEAEEKEKEKQERIAFKKMLKKLPIGLNEVNDRFQLLYNKLKKKLSISDVAYQDIQSLLREIDDLKVDIENLEPKEPKRFTMDSRDRENFEDALVLHSDYVERFESINQLREKALAVIAEEQLLKEFENKFHNYQSLLNSITEKSKNSLKEGFKHIDTEFEKTKGDFKDKLTQLYNHNLPVPPPSRKKIETSLKNLEIEFSVLRSEYQNILDSKSEHLKRLNFGIDDDALVGLYKEKYEESLKELGNLKNMAQLGIAVEIINHELNSMYSQLSSSILEIGKHLKDTKESQKHYKYLNNSFEHLDSKYQSLNPLYRKSKRTKKYIKGVEIKEYLNIFFEETFKEEGVKLETTNSFDDSETYTFESILLPAFINVINNAIYWVRSAKSPRILIDFEEKTKTIIINNNGPKIRDTSLNEIFELFYTRRPKGRGIGLYLSRDGLNTTGMNIMATNDSKYNKLEGAAFLILPNQNK